MPRFHLFFKSFLTVLFIGITSSSCTTIEYYSQSASGHLTIWWAAKPIETILQEKTIDEGTLKKLETAVSVRRFASEALKLPDNHSYLKYADIGRPHVVWNVTAAPEFSVSPKLWCYLFVGCVGYRGYYHEQDAHDYATQLEADHYDVNVSGVSAYSTLGYFDDPLLNTMINWSDRAIASLMFHELTHQVLYIDGDADFNEAFATAVEQLGTVYWLRKNQTGDIEDYLRLVEQQMQFRKLLLDARQQLQLLYAKTELDDTGKRQQKKQIIEHLKQQYEQEKLAWYKPNQYDNWFSRPINNARLTATMTYLERIPAFFAIFQDTQQDWQKFYVAAKNLGQLEKTEREKHIQTLISKQITLRQLFDFANTSIH